MVPQFEILEHTADIGVRAWGASLEELFANAAFGLQSIAFEAPNVTAGEPHSIQAEGEDLEALLVNFLNDVVFYLDARRVAFARFDLQLTGAARVSGQGWGEPRDPVRHRARLVVKAATYHQLRVAREPDRWVAEVYLDI